jgi:hypothetical protein
MNTSLAEPKLTMPKYHCALCNRSSKTKKLWSDHLNCDLHRKRRKAFLEKQKEEIDVITARIKDDLEKLERLKGDRKIVKKLKVTESNDE